MTDTETVIIVERVEPPDTSVSVIELGSDSYSGVEDTIVVFTVNRADGWSDSVSVDWAITGVPIEEANTPSSGTLVFQAGEGVKSVNIEVNQVNLDTVGTLQLTNPTNLSGTAVPVLGANDVASFTVTDIPVVTDININLSDNAYTGTEQTNMTFAVNRDGSESTDIVTVDWVIADATVIPSSGTVTFNIGDTQKNVTVAAQNIGSTEIGSLTLSNPTNLSGGVVPVLTSPQSAVFTIAATLQVTLGLLTEDTLINVWPNSVWFMNFIVGEGARQESINIYNPSAVTIQLNSYNNSNGTFDILGLAQDESFAPGETKTFVISYNPGVGGAQVRMGSLTLNFDNGESPTVAIWSSKFDSARTVIPVTSANNTNLNVEGAIYQLQNDVSAPGTAFNVTAKYVTLDTNGHRIRFGTNGGNDAVGIQGNAGVGGGFSEGFHVYSSVGTGYITEDDFEGRSSTGNNRRCLLFEGQAGETDIQVGPNLEMQWYGRDSQAFQQHNQPRGFWTHGVYFNCGVIEVSDRHNFRGYPCKVSSQGAGATPTRNRWHDLTFTGSPQGGITEYSGGDEEQIYDCYFDNDNRFANGFSIQTGIGGMAFNNTINNTSGRGIFLKDINVRIWGNHITINGLKQNYNPESDSWNNPTNVVCEDFGAYGIQFESGMANARVYHNTIIVRATTCQVVGLKCTETTAGGDNLFFRNHVTAKRIGASTANSFAVTFGSGCVGQPGIINNTFVVDHVGCDFDWSAGTNIIWRNNTWLVGDNPAPTVYWMRFRNGNPAELATGHKHYDSVFGPGISEEVNDDAPIGARKAYSYEMWYTLSLAIIDGPGNPVNAATIVIKDDDNTTVFNSTSNASGLADTELEQKEVHNTAGSARVVTTETPHTVTITKAGFSPVVYVIDMDSTKTLTVDLAASTAEES